MLTRSRDSHESMPSPTFPSLFPEATTFCDLKNVVCLFSNLVSERQLPTDHKAPAPAEMSASGTHRVAGAASAVLRWGFGARRREIVEPLQQARLRRLFENRQDLMFFFQREKTVLNYVPEHSECSFFANASPGPSVSFFSASIPV